MVWLKMNTVWLIVLGATTSLAAESTTARILHFPKDRSLGKLYISTDEVSKEFAYWFHWTRAGEHHEYLCEAEGEVHVPAGMRLSLSVHKTARRDLSPLSKLRPDDFYGLALPASSEEPDKPSDVCMPHITHLTGLRSLSLGQTAVTDRGMEYIAGLTNMERLGIGGSGLTDEGLKYLANMKKLNLLYIRGAWDRSKQAFDGGGNITDKGLRQLEVLKALGLLEIYSDNTFNDAALRRLQRELPNLFRLRINGGILQSINSKDMVR